MIGIIVMRCIMHYYISLHSWLFRLLHYISLHL